MENLANQLLDTFTNTNKNITKSHIPTANTLARIDVLVQYLKNESKIHLKHGRPVDSNDVTPWKMRTQ